MQIALLLRRMMLQYVACLAVPYFSHYLINGTIFRKIIIDNKTRVLFSFTTFV
jgi:hypothetical protein